MPEPAPLTANRGLVSIVWVCHCPIICILWNKAFIYTNQHHPLLLEQKYDEVGVLGWDLLPPHVVLREHGSIAKHMQGSSSLY